VENPSDTPCLSGGFGDGRSSIPKTPTSAAEHRDSGRRTRNYPCDVSEPATGAASEAELKAFRRAAQALVDGVTDHLAALPSGPVWQPLPDALREQLLDLPLPERGGALDDLVATVLRDVLPHAMGMYGPLGAVWRARRNGLGHWV
jgi:hypothetical protein